MRCHTLTQLQGDGDNRICVFGPSQGQEGEPGMPEPWALLAGWFWAESCLIPTTIIIILIPSFSIITIKQHQSSPAIITRHSRACCRAALSW